VAATTGGDFGGGREGFLPVRIPEDRDGGRRGRSGGIWQTLYLQFRHKEGCFVPPWNI